MAEMLTEYLTDEDGTLVVDPAASCYRCTQDAFMAGGFAALTSVFFPDVEGGLERAAKLLTELRAYRQRTIDGVPHPYLATARPAGRA